MDCICESCARKDCPERTKQDDLRIVISCLDYVKHEMTNADRIRAMSDVELAEFLCGVYDDDNCGVYQAESGKFINGITILDYDEFKILEWLLQPAEVDNG